MELKGDIDQLQRQKENQKPIPHQKKLKTNLKTWKIEIDLTHTIKKLGQLK